VVHSTDPNRLLEEEPYKLAINAMSLIETGLLRSISARFCDGNAMIDDREISISRIIMTIRANFSQWEESGYIPNALENRRWEAHPSYVEPVPRSHIRSIATPIEIQAAEEPKNMMSLSVDEFVIEMTRLGMDDAVADLNRFVAQAESLRRDTENPLLECPICWEEKKMKLMCMTNCKHVFCKLCSVKLFVNNLGKCAMCRKNIKSLKNIA